MKKLIYVRHGQSQANFDNIYGAFDSPLTDLGRQEAADASRLVGTAPDLIITSPQPRAAETARIIAKGINYSGEIRQNHDSVERDYGGYEGSEFLHDSDSLDVSKDPAAETMEELLLRAQEFYSYLKTLPEDTILVTSHGAFGRALVRAINGLNADAPVDFLENAKPLVLVNN